MLSTLRLSRSSFHLTTYSLGPRQGVQVKQLLKASQPFTTSALTMSSTPGYQIVSTPSAPKAIGPYSQATVHNGVAYLSGCIPFVPSTMQVVEGGIEEQTQQALDNLFEVVKAAGSDKSHILKMTVFLKDMNHFAKVNEIYEKVCNAFALPLSDLCSFPFNHSKSSFAHEIGFCQTRTLLPSSPRDLPSRSLDCLAMFSSRWSASLLSRLEARLFL